jgi:hypothetical protein
MHVEVGVLSASESAGANSGAVETPARRLPDAGRPPPTALDGTMVAS